MPAAAAPAVQPSRDFEIATNPIGLELRKLVVESDQLTNIIRSVAEVICRETQCLAMWISQRDPQTGELRTHALTDDNADSVAEIAGPRLGALLADTIETCTLGSVQISENHSIVASSIGTNIEQCDMVLTGCFVHTASTTKHQQWMMNIGSQTLSLIHI